MKPLIHSLALLTIAATLAVSVRADSLFPGSSTDVARNHTDSASLFSDNKAFRVGDTLTVVITENGTASSVAATKTAKTESLNYGPGFGPLLSNLKNFGLSGGINSDASGSTTRADTLTASIGVTVTKVLPNGNLEVEGKRKVGMNAETQEITLTGIVRPTDIASNNTIASPLVADAQIQYGGRGPVGDKQHDGLISRIFKFLF
ncbi:MAG: flagellar basal body L-ring protein FlgH [Janthinobacterium lividum]